MQTSEEKAFQYTPEVMENLHKVELELLIELDRICRKHNIPYQLDGGTLLGAVRYQGFIPWDDDVDVRMLRKDYDRFYQVCKKELDKKRFFLQTYHSDPGYRWGYGKLIRKGTKYLRLHQEMLTMKKCVFMDIFPCDNMPEKGLPKVLYNFFCFFIRKTSYSPVGAKYEKNLFYKCIYKVLAHLPIKVVRKGFDFLAYQYSGTKTKFVRTPAWGYWQESAGYLRRWMDESCELMFEGHRFLAPKDYHGYLSYLYGEDYMTPPPKEKQVPENTATYIDFGNVLNSKN